MKWDERHNDLRFLGLNVTPHIAQNERGRRSAINSKPRSTRGYVISQQKHKRTEESFGWSMTICGLARLMLRRARRLAFKFTLTMAAQKVATLTGRNASRLNSVPAREYDTQGITDVGEEQQTTNNPNNLVRV